MPPYWTRYLGPPSTHASLPPSPGEYVLHKRIDRAVTDLTPWRKRICTYHANYNIESPTASRRAVSCQPFTGRLLAGVSAQLPHPQRPSNCGQ